jgi:hypothetical protein
MMGRTIATCFQRVGKNGATMVEDGQVRLEATNKTKTKRTA